MYPCSTLFRLQAFQFRLFFRPLTIDFHKRRMALDKLAETFNLFLSLLVIYLQCIKLICKICAIVLQLLQTIRQRIEFGIVNSFV